MIRRILNLGNKIKSEACAFVLLQLTSILPRFSDQMLIKISYLCQNVFFRKDPVLEAAFIKIRQHLREGAPTGALARRILLDLNPKCRKTLVKNFFINAAFKGTSENKKYQEEEGFEPPWFLALSPVMKCNLNCIGCSTRRYTKDEDMPLKDMERILDEARSMGVHFVVTQGGEMFLYEEMYDLYEKYNDIYFQVYTNGTLIDKQVAKRLARLGNVAPMISLEGSRDATDGRRGKGVFDKVMQAMDNLRQERCFFGASVTQTSKNTDEILSDEFFELLLRKGCYVIWFFQFLPVGKDPDISLMATPMQRNSLRLKVSQIRGRLPIFIGDFWNDGPYLGGCIAAGRRYIHINNKGDIEPCAFAHFSVDNIKDKSLKEALNSRFFKFIRTQQPFGNGNTLTPCMIIDNPQILREAVTRSEAKPTHEGAEMILNGSVAKGIDEYSARIHEITEPVWQAMNNNGKPTPS